MSTFNRKLGFKEQPVASKSCAYSLLDSAFRPRAQVAPLGAKSPRCIVARIKPLTAMCAVYPQVVCYCASVRTAIARISFSVRWFYREHLSAILTRPKYSNLITFFSLVRVVTVAGTEAQDSLTTPYSAKRLAAKLASDRRPLRVCSSNDLVARDTLHLLYALHLAESNHIAAKAKVCVENLSLRWRVVPDRCRVLDSQGVTLRDKVAFMVRAVGVFPHLSGLPILVL